MDRLDSAGTLFLCTDEKFCVFLFCVKVNEDWKLWGFVWIVFDRGEVRRFLDDGFNYILCLYVCLSTVPSGTEGKSTPSDYVVLLEMEKYF